ncbi:MAG: hypothetical protein WCO63_13290 [Bacteroidota bacterium]
MKVEKISHGATFEGSLSTAGLILGIAGIILIISYFNTYNSFIFTPIGILFLLVGLIVFISIKGVLIDIENRKIKKYFDVFLVKFGKWQPLDHFTTVTLNYSSISQAMHSRGNSSDILNRLYTITLTNDKHQELKIKEFVAYEDAVVFLDEFAKKNNMETKNTFEILKEQIQERKQSLRKQGLI